MEGSHFPPGQGTFRKIGVQFWRKSRRGGVYPAVFRTRQGESGRRPISCVRFTLSISRYPAVSRFDQGIPCCDVYSFIFSFYLVVF